MTNQSIPMGSSVLKIARVFHQIRSTIVIIFQMVSGVCDHCGNERTIWADEMMKYTFSGCTTGLVCGVSRCTGIVWLKGAKAAINSLTGGRCVKGTCFQCRHERVIYATEMGKYFYKHFRAFKEAEATGGLSLLVKGLPSGVICQHRACKGVLIVSGAE